MNESEKSGNLQFNEDRMHLGILLNRIPLIINRIDQKHARELRDRFADMMQTMIRLKVCPTVIVLFNDGSDLVERELPLVKLEYDAESENTSTKTVFVNEDGMFFRFEHESASEKGTALEWEKAMQLTPREIIMEEERSLMTFMKLINGVLKTSFSEE